MYERQIFRDAWGLGARVEAVDDEQLGRPVREAGSPECPAPHVSEPLSLCEVERLERAGIRDINHQREIYGAPITWQLLMADPQKSAANYACDCLRRPNSCALTATITVDPDINTATIEVLAPR